MPRDGSDIYHIPPGTEGEPDTTIESAKYNAFIADIEQDLNAPRPIVAGGTGATNAEDAMVTLGGELAGQVVTNYDSHVFRAGSFLSLAGATSAPNGHAFTGICYKTDDNNLFIEARDNDDATQNWVRQKKAGVWQAWMLVTTATSSETAPSNPAPNTVWFDPTVGKSFIWYVDPDSAQWVEMTAVPDVDPQTYVEIAGDTMTGPLTLSGAPTLALHAATKAYADLGVRADAAQALTVAQKEQARSNIYAAPFDALAYNGLQINGACEVSQEVGSTGITLVPPGNEKYVVDNWKLGCNHASANFSAARTAIASLFGFSQSVRFTSTVPMTSLAAGNYAYAVHPIEGYRCARLGWGKASAHPITVGFWVIGENGAAGTATMAVRNSGSSRSYTVNFPVTANWAYHAITIPGDTAGTWGVAEGLGISLSFCFGSGATYQAASEKAWYGGNYIATPQTTNHFSAANHSVYMTGLVVMPGLELPSSDRSSLLMRPFSDELRACMRYFRKTTGQPEPSIYGYAGAAGIFLANSYVHPPMRVSPTITPIGPWLNQNCSAPATISGAGGDSYLFYVTSNAAGQVIQHGSGSGYLTFDARL